MASESSSAVLDLKDDPDDTDGAETLHEGVGDDPPPPLLMEHGYDIAVKVDAPQKQLSTLETYVTYRVRCACARWQTPAQVRRRYNHFKVLHSRLSSSQAWIAAPPLPPLHSARQQLDRYSRGFVAVRTVALDAFLNRVAKHPILTHSEDFRIFLTTPDEEIDKVFKSENSALNLWGLSSAFYGSSENKTVNGARVKDPEFTAASDYLQSLQQKLTTLCTVTNKLYKGSTELGAEYKGLHNASSAWSSSERGAVSSALSGAAAGAGGAAGARARGALRHRAILPLLAAYCEAQANKCGLRDQAHAAYVAASNSTDELHNRLEQASEALRSELADWTTKTHADIKSILLELAERQVIMHQQTLMGWEHALKMATESNVENLFKTVSKSAVQNLSPTKCQNNPLDEPATDKDLDDIDLENCSSNSDLQELNSRVDLNLESGSDVKNVECNSAVLDLSESVSDVRVKTDSLSLVEPEVSEGSRVVTSDPLQDFAEVDLNDS